jgi:hypothetical protein
MKHADAEDVDFGDAAVAQASDHGYRRDDSEEEFHILPCKRKYPNPIAIVARSDKTITPLSFEK